MKILITGGAGYIGAETSYSMLKKKIKPIFIDKLIYRENNIIPKKSIFYKINTSNANIIKKIIKKHYITSVMHFAAYKDVEESVANPSKYITNNYLLTKKFIKCCKENGIKNFIFSSTASVYGKLKKNKKVSENYPLKSISMYGLIKKKIEEYLKKISDNNFKFFSLRYFNVLRADKNLRYGPIGLKNYISSNNLYKSILLNKDFKIFADNHDTRDGTPVRDFIQIDDLAEIHYKSLLYLKKNKKNQICNCSYGRGYSIEEVINILLKSKKIDWRPRNSNLKKMIFSELRWKKKLNNN